MIDFELTEEQKMVQKMVGEFAMAKIAPRVEEMENNEKIPDEIIQGLAEQGLMGMPIDPKYGGSGSDPITVGIAGEQLGRADISCSIPVFFLVPAAWGIVLQKYGNEQLKQEVLPKVTSGKIFLGIGSTEPNTGSDVLNIKTKAHKEGNEWVLNGEKMYISGVKEVIHQMPEGGGYMTIIKTDESKGAKGLSLFYVPLRDVEGITPTYLEDWGRKGISTGGFAMEDVRIPEHYLIGEEGKGFYYLMEGFDYARAIIALVCCGAAMQGMEYAMEYIKERHAFGTPLAKYEGVQFKLAENWGLIEGIRMLGLKALWMVDQEQKGKADRFDVTHQVAMSKMLAPPYAHKALDDALQWYGAYGFTTECPLHLGIKGVRSYMWAEGAHEIQKMIVARGLLGKDFVATK